MKNDRRTLVRATVPSLPKGLGSSGVRRPNTCQGGHSSGCTGSTMAGKTPDSIEMTDLCRQGSTEFKMWFNEPRGSMQANCTRTLELR
jgi:hypothetical protein